ncbi:MAG: phosphatase PAP2 family protein [Phycisphaeraceae bacterium]
MKAEIRNSKSEIAASQRRPPLLWPIVIAAVAFAVLLPFDAAISKAVEQIRPTGGDIKRLMETVQQFGDIVSIILVSTVIWLLDPPNRRRLLDLVLATVLAAIVYNALKMGIGRPRPVLGDPYGFTWPWMTHAVAVATDAAADLPQYHAWHIGAPNISRLWAMPSSHTAAAMVMAVFLTYVYPRLKALMVTLVVLVGLCRVMLGAHYPTDVVAGAIVGYLVAAPIISRGLMHRRGNTDEHG